MLRSENIAKHSIVYEIVRLETSENLRMLAFDKAKTYENLQLYWKIVE